MSCTAFQLEIFLVYQRKTYSCNDQPPPPPTSNVKWLASNAFFEVFFKQTHFGGSRVTTRRLSFLLYMSTILVFLT